MDEGPLAHHALSAEPEDARAGVAAQRTAIVVGVEDAERSSVWLAKIRSLGGDVVPAAVAVEVVGA